MAASNELVFIVKRTFLEVVNHENSGGCTGRSRCRTISDTCFELPETPHHATHASSDEGLLPHSKDNCSDASTHDFDDSDDEATRVSSQAASSRIQSWADELPIDSQERSQEQERTTVMFRNVPNDYARDALMQLLDDEGFAGKYNFIYLPVDFRSKSGFGYAFINLVDGKVAETFMKAFNGFAKWNLPSQKVAEVTWSHPSQGLDIHVERYRNSPVMHEAVPDAFKPAMFENGKRIAFPAPTKAIKMPRIRHSTKRQ